MEPGEFDQKLCPECEQGKHFNCTEEVLVEVEGVDEWVICECLVCAARRRARARWEGERTP